MEGEEEGWRKLQSHCLNETVGGGGDQVGMPSGRAASAQTGTGRSVHTPTDSGRASSPTANSAGPLRLGPLASRRGRSEIVGGHKQRSEYQRVAGGGQLRPGR